MRSALRRAPGKRGVRTRGRTAPPGCDDPSVLPRGGVLDAPASFIAMSAVTTVHSCVFASTICPFGAGASAGISASAVPATLLAGRRSEASGAPAARTPSNRCESATGGATESAVDNAVAASVAASEAASFSDAASSAIMLSNESAVLSREGARDATAASMANSRSKVSAPSNDGAREVATDDAFEMCGWMPHAAPARGVSRWTRRFLSRWSSSHFCWRAASRRIWT